MDLHQCLLKGLEINTVASCRTFQMDFFFFWLVCHLFIAQMALVPVRVQ